MADHNINPVEVPAPPVVPRPRGLLTHVTRPLDTGPARPTDTGDRDYDVESRIAAGITFCSDGCGGLTPLENLWCEDTTLPEDYAEADTVGPFSSFWVQADDLSPARTDPAYIVERLRRRREATISAAIARELLTGATTGNPSLSSEAKQVVAAATPVGEVLYVLEDLMAAYDGMRFTIHTSPGVFELLIAEYDIAQDDRETAEDPNRLPFRTPTGHIVVGDAGHDGSVPPEGSTTSASSEWIFAHGGDVVLWSNTPRAIGDETANFDRTNNRRSTVIGSDVLVAFDPCASMAVQVDVPAYTVVDGPGAEASG